MSPLRQHMIAALHLSGKSERTQEAYVRAVRLLAQFSLCFRPACVNLDFPWPTVILIPERKPTTWRPLCRLTPFYTPNTNSTN